MNETCNKTIKNTIEKKIYKAIGLHSIYEIKLVKLI